MASTDSPREPAPKNQSHEIPVSPLPLPAIRLRLSPLEQVPLANFKEAYRPVYLQKMYPPLLFSFSHRSGPWLGILLAGVLTLSSLSAADFQVGSFELGEGNEVVVTKGSVVREVQPSEPGKLPCIAVGSADGFHYLYDPNQFAMQAIWTGRFGQEHTAGGFVPGMTNLKSFSLRANPWTFGEKPRRKLDHEWLGLEGRDGRVWFRYRLSDEKTGLFWEVEETLETVDENQQRLLFGIKASGHTEEHLNYWVRQTDFRRLSTDGQQNQRDTLKNLYPNQKSFTIAFYRRKESPTLPHGFSVRELAVPVPAMPFRFEPTGFGFAQDGTVYVTTRTGGVWRRKNEQWSLFAEGLHEANGIQVTPDGEGVYAMQKPELTFLRDTDHDGIADVYQTVEDRFRFSGQYHEFAYGPRMNSRGDLFFTTGLSAGGHFSAAPGGYPNQMTSSLGYRGWVMKKDSAGNLTPFASGLRSPAGIGMNAKDELFVTDNQGDWVASSYLAHVEEGDFLGHPASLWDRPEFGLTPRLLDYKTNMPIPKEVPPLDPKQFTKLRKLPAVWLAHGDLTNSPGHPSFAPKSGFGPFGGQAFIADLCHRSVVRVFLEKVGGRYQGAVFPFLRPLKSASYSTAFDGEGNLWVGSVGRGWTAGDPAIELIHFEPGAVPFEIQRMELTRSGFDVVLTQPIDSRTLSARDISVTEYQYNYWDGYGSEPIHEKNVPVDEVTVSADRTVVSLRFPQKAEFIYQVQLPVLNSRSGLPLENNYGIYTLNRLLP